MGRDPAFEQYAEKVGLTTGEATAVVVLPKAPRDAAPQYIAGVLAEHVVAFAGSMTADDGIVIEAFERVATAAEALQSLEFFRNKLTGLEENPLLRALGLVPPLQRAELTSRDGEVRFHLALSDGEVRALIDGIGRVFSEPVRTTLSGPAGISRDAANEADEETAPKPPSTGGETRSGGRRPQRRSP